MRKTRRKFSSDEARASKDAARARLAIDSLARFVRYAWPIVEPGRELIWNWHLDVICHALERQAAGDPEYRKILVCIPPGTMKSLLVSVFAPAWRWLNDPGARSLFLANDDDLVVRDSRRTRDIINSEWYQEILAASCDDRDEPPWTLENDQNKKTNFENTKKGFRQCMGINAAIIGRRGDNIVIDDPIDAKAVVNGSVSQVATRLSEINNIIEVALPSRVNDLATATWTIIMQRLHPDDPAGRAIRKGGWKVIQIAMEFDPSDPLNHPDDPRTEHGELMFSAKFARAQVEELKETLGARNYLAQYGQKPTSVSGKMFRREWLGLRYQQDPLRLALTLDEIALTLDCTFKRTDDTDYVVLQTWGRKAGRFYLLDQVRARMNYPETRQALRDMVLKWPRAVMKLVEEKANGPALIDDLKSSIHGLVPYDPKISKEARAQVVLPLFEAGNVYLPEAEFAPWIQSYIEELADFPEGPNDDQVDATTQLLLKWTQAQNDDPIEKLKRRYAFLGGEFS